MKVILLFEWNVNALEQLFEGETLIWYASNTRHHQHASYKLRP